MGKTMRWCEGRRYRQAVGTTSSVEKMREWFFLYGRMLRSRNGSILFVYIIAPAPVVKDVTVGFTVGHDGIR